HKGFNLNLTTLRRLQRDLGLHKRIKGSRHKEIAIEIWRVLKEELNNSKIKDFRHIHLYTYIRSKYNMISRYVLTYKASYGANYSADYALNRLMYYRDYIY
ncbi:hypothetical protein K431DRAFT_234945, partial [Polychaeton citri CBS 116435]